MKRISITSLLSITALILAAVIVSCSSGNSKNTLGKKQLETVLEVEASDDLIAASDIEITYKGKGGVDVTDTITSTSWRKKIVNDSFPTEIGVVNYRMLLKQDPKFVKDRCQLGLKLMCQSTTMSLINMPIDKWTVQLIDIDDIDSNKVADYLDLQDFTPGLFNNGIYGFHTLLQKVSINKGKFEIENMCFTLEEPNKHEPSKETEL